MAGRRTFLKALAGIGMVVVLPAGALAGWIYASAGRSNVGTLSFRNPLRIPRCSSRWQMATRSGSN